MATVTGWCSLLNNIYGSSTEIINIHMKRFLASFNSHEAICVVSISTLAVAQGTTQRVENNYEIEAHIIIFYSI